MGVGGIWDYFCLNLVRLHTSFGRMISYASFLILQIPLCFIVLFYSKNKLLKSGAFIGIILLFFCLILNATRAAWVAIVVSLIIISFFKNRKFACGLLICIIIGGLFLPAQLKYRAITTADPLTWGERVPLWNIAIRMFNDYPIFGVGLGMQEKLFSTYWKQSIYFPTFKYWHSHNNYLEIAAETGIVGILSFLYIFVTFLKNAYSRGKLLKDNESIVFLGLTGCIIATLILAMSDSNVTVGVQDAAVFWFIFGIVSGLIFFRKTPENIA
ncbi:MAG: O-antigen ligase family protein [Candidatus Omnitrophota bacterium]